MSQQAQSTNVLPASLVLMALATGGLLLLEQPFKSSRHSETGTSATLVAPSEQFVHARLWQDPMRPIQADWQRLLSSVDESDLDKIDSGDGGRLNLPNDELPPTIHDFRESVAARARSVAPSECDPGYSGILVLPILMPGSNYSTDVELRRRSRYALISALTASGYPPESAQKIGYFVAPRAVAMRPESADKDDAVPDWRRPVLVGYEWFLSRRTGLCPDALSQWDAVLALWINENDLGWNPLARLDTILANIAPQSRTRGNESADVTFNVIGPSSSAVLATMYREVQMYSPQVNRFTRVGPVEFANQFAVAVTDYSIECAIRTSLRPYNENCAAGEDGRGGAAGSALSPAAPEQTVTPLTELDPSPDDLYSVDADYAVDTLVNALDSYLFSGLPEGFDDSQVRVCAQPIVDGQAAPESRSSGLAVLDSARICLADMTELDNIADATTEWRHDIARAWLEHANWGLLNPDLEIQIADAAEVSNEETSDDVASLLIATNYYLDWGIPPGADIVAAFECLEDKIVQEDAGQSVDDIAVCLNDNLEVEAKTEGDPNWAESVAIGWQDTNFHLLYPGDPPVLDESPLAPIEIPESVFDKTQILSWRSTMPLSVIASQDVGRRDSQVQATQVAKNAGAALGQVRTDDKFLETLHTAGIPLRGFRSTVARDQWTAAVLVEELWRRGVFDNDRDDIAILFEVDSEYGRTLPRIVECYVQQIYDLKRELGNKAKISSTESGPGKVGSIRITVEDTPCLFRGDRRGEKNTVHSYGYFTGIDGMEVAGRMLAAQASGSSGSDGDTSSDREQGILELPANLELPVGTSQFDYLRRLARVITQKDEELHEMGSAGLRAVGIFGTDIYDKQLILQALHQSLPNTVFFTTDLDARLAHPSQYEWNRNLLVASGYGLGIGSTAFSLIEPGSSQSTENRDGVDSAAGPESTSSVEIELPPLRDGYQTAFFLTTKLALIDNLNLEADYFGQKFTPPLPRLFEIGRYGEVDITPVPKDLAASGCEYSTSSASEARDNQIHYSSIDACIHGRLGWTQYKSFEQRIAINAMVLLSPLLLLTYIWARNWQRVNKKRQFTEWRCYRAATIVGVLSIVLIFCCLLFWTSPSAEPWLLFDGISAMPTIVLRFVALIYSILIAIIAYGRFKQNNVNLAKRFDLDAGSPATGMQATKHYSVVEWIREINEKTRHGVRYNVEANEVWLRYRELGSPYARIRRAAPIASFFSVAVVSWFLLGMHDHALMRGWLVMFDTAITSITAVTVLFVIFMTTDSMHLCQTFIRALARYDVKWPPPDDDPVFKKMDIDPMIYFRVRCVDMIKYRTEMITPTVIMPFALIFFLLVARSDLFDNWEWNAPLMTLYVGLSIYLLIRALLMQREAEHARHRIVLRLRRRRNGILDEYVKDPAIMQKHLSQTDSLIDYVIDIRRGAFVPWLQHPIVQAILLPFTGFGAIAILDAFL